MINEPQMQFSRDLGPSTEASQSLIQLNESETKLWEEIRSYVDKRSKIDLEYAERISKLHHLSKIDSSSSNGDGSLLEKAWKTYINETENKSITMTQIAKNIQGNVLTKLDRILNSKKDVIKKYKLDRSHYDMDFNCSKDEIKRLAENYRHSLKEVKKIRDHLDDVSNRKKAEKEWKKSKEKLDKASLKLHTTHNEYILAIKVANEHQAIYHRSIIPSLLDHMEATQESYIGEMKDVMESIFENTNWCRDEFVDSAKHVENSIKLIDKKQEYKAFATKNKKQIQPIFPFYFEETLDTACQSLSGLVKDELALNDLTYEQLKYKLKSFESQLETTRTEIKLKEDALQRVENDLGELSSDKKADKPSNISVIEKMSQLRYLQREVNKLSCKEALASVQLATINDKVKELGDSLPPAYITLQPPCYTEEKVADHKLRARSLNIESERKTEKKDRRSLFFAKKTKSSPDESPDDDMIGEYIEPAEEVPLAAVPWFHGNIDRRSAERLLKKDGDFLVREKSDGSGIYVVSVMFNGSYKHFLLNKAEDGRFKFESEAFGTVQCLIRHHHQNCIPIKMADQVVIVNPVAKAFLEGDKFSHASSNVRMDVKLGNGHFGDVFKGMLIKERLLVAIKTCKAGVDDIVKKKFLEEAEIMKPYDHPNVVKLVGVCNDKEPYMILMELMPFGDLSSFLKKTGTCLGMDELLKLSMDAANGMGYLESKNTIHRDLAARNVLIGENHVAKISDFGMSREEDDDGIYTMQTTKEIPIKWTAPEVWHYHQYTSKSDVWSFGVLLWEIFSVGNVPYPGWNNKKTREMIENGYRMPLPSGTPLKVYQIMSKCWEYEAERRPNFADIVKDLLACSS